MRPPPRPWAAVLLALAAPGLGHLYADRPWRALAWTVAVPALALAIVLVVMYGPIHPFALGAVVVPTLASIVDAWLCARRARGARTLASRWFVLLAAYLIVGCGGSPLVAEGLLRRFRTFTIPSAGMAPTISAGDRFLADPSRRDVVRGRSLVFLFPEDRSRKFVKRVIGVAGDTVEIRDKTVVVNGKPLVEPYAQFMDDSPETGERDFGPVTVPADQFFVLGDNRDNSRDSRFWGFVPVADVVATPVKIYWSRDPSTGVIAWDRIGRRLDVAEP